MADFPLPTAASIRVTADLRPENVSLSLADDAALEVDIAGRIATQANNVQRRLVRAAAPLQWPFTRALVAAAYDNATEAQQDAIITSETTDATEATRLYTLQDLFSSAGDGSDQYDQEAADYERRADKIMASLIDEITFVKAQAPINNNSEGMAVVTVLVGESYSEDEYSSA